MSELHTYETAKFLREVEERAKTPEMLELILKYALKGVSDKNLELRKQVSDMETVAAMAINEREYKKQAPFIIQKLEAWKHTSALRWDDTIARLKGKLNND
jgi:hypothetical protein